MKLNLTFLFYSTFLSFFSFGQSFSWYPNDSTVTDLNPSIETQMKLNQLNLTGDTLNLGIEVVYNDIPGSWDGMVCLYGICLGHIPAVGFTFNQSPIFGLDSGYVRLTANPMGNTDPCMLRIRVHNLDAPFESDTATWILNSSYLTAEEYLNNINEIKVYPNPTNDYVRISSKLSFDRIDIVNSMGQEVYSESYKNLNYTELYLNLKSGVYFINGYKNNDKIIKEKLIINE